MKKNALLVFSLLGCAALAATLTLESGWLQIESDIPSQITVEKSSAPDGPFEYVLTTSMPPGVAKLPFKTGTDRGFARIVRSDLPADTKPTFLLLGSFRGERNSTEAYTEGDVAMTETGLEVLRRASDGTLEWQLLVRHGATGPTGANGADGAPGADGLPGLDGRDGRDGAQGPGAIPRIPSAGLIRPDTTYRNLGNGSIAVLLNVLLAKAYPTRDVVVKAWLSDGSSPEFLVGSLTAGSTTPARRLTIPAFECAPGYSYRVQVEQGVVDEIEAVVFR